MPPTSIVYDKKPPTLSTLPAELRCRIWQLTLPLYQIHRIEIRDQSEDSWIQVIKSPMLPAALYVSRDSRAMILRRLKTFSPYVRLSRNDKGSADLQSWGHDGVESVGFFNPETDFLHVENKFMVFPLNLEKAPFRKLSIRVEPDKDQQEVGEDELEENRRAIEVDICFPSKKVFRAYKPWLLQIHLVFDWRIDDFKEHKRCNRTIPVRKPVSWGPRDGLLIRQAIDHWLFVDDEDTDDEDADEEEPESPVQTNEPNSFFTFPGIIPATMPMACSCPGMVEAVTNRSNEASDEEMAKFHPGRRQRLE